MKKPKFTPGPWNSYSDGSKAWVSSVKPYRLICQMSADRERGDAEARLIAAAPDMAKALTNLLDSTDLNLDEGMDETTTEAIGAAQEALKKAGLL